MQKIRSRAAVSALVILIPLAVARGGYQTPLAAAPADGEAAPPPVCPAPHFAQIEAEPLACGTFGDLLATAPHAFPQLLPSQPRPMPAVELPPPPGSLSLGLAALASLGAVQAGRSLRRLQFSNLPEWYHEHAPPQIGHAHVLSFHDLEPAVCRLTDPFPAAAPPAARLRPAAYETPPRQFIPCCAAPRAPPTIL